MFTKKHIAHPITVTDFLWEKHLSVTKQGPRCIESVVSLELTHPLNTGFLSVVLREGHLVTRDLRGPKLWSSRAVPTCEGASSLIISCLCAPYSGDKQNGSSWPLLAPVLGATVWPSPWGRCGHIGCWHTGDQLVARRLSM